MAPSSDSRTGARHAPRMVEMKVCEGNRMGSNLFYPADNTGYLYRVKRRRGSTLYFSCARNGCRATANFKKKKQLNLIKKGVMKGLFEITSNHGHQEDPSVLVKLKFESACKKRSMYEETPYSVIIKEEKVKWQVDNIKEAGLISTLYQARKRSTLDGPPATDGSVDTEDSMSEDDNIHTSTELSYTRAGYRVERWKWVIAMLREKGARLRMQGLLNLRLPEEANADEVEAGVEGDEEGTQRYTFSDIKVHKDEASSQEQESSQSNLEVYPTAEDINEEQLLRSYGLDRLPLFLPCVKKCPQNPFCLTGYKIGTVIKGGCESKLPLTQQPRTAPNYPVGLQDCPATAWVNPGLQIFYHLRKFRNAVNSLDDFNFDTSLTSLAHLLQVLFAEMETHAFKTLSCEGGSILERIGEFADREVSRRSGHGNARCVTEFLETTLDWLVAETSLAAAVAPLFTIHMTKIVQWQCSKCGTLHQFQVSPSSSYSLASYISEDQALLQHSILDMHVESQCGVQAVCGQGWPGGVRLAGQEGAGCGAPSKVDAVATPKMTNTPYYLIIKNNSIISQDPKRRLHAVFPDHLNLSEHTLDRRAAHYVLSAVVFHHGGADRHYTSHIKTEGGRWFSFHEESVLEMSSKHSAATQSCPGEAHPNYLSQGGVSLRYKSRGGVRVSRSALLWLYTLVDLQPVLPLVPPRASVMTYINSQESQESKQRFRVQSKRQDLLKDLTVRSKHEQFVLLPEVVLEAWAASEDQRFVLPLSLLRGVQRDTEGGGAYICRHGRIKPMAASKFKCIRREMVPYLINSNCGITTASKEKQQQNKSVITSSKVSEVEVATTGNAASQQNITAEGGQGERWKKGYSSAPGDGSTNSVLDLDCWRVQQNTLQFTAGSPTVGSIFSAGLNHNALGANCSSNSSSGDAGVTHTNSYLLYNAAGHLAGSGGDSGVSHPQALDTGLNLTVNQSNSSAAGGVFTAGNNETNGSSDSRNAAIHSNQNSIPSTTAYGHACGGVAADSKTVIIDNDQHQSDGTATPLKQENDDPEIGLSTAVVQGCPFLFTTSSLCRECVAEHARHIRFLERLRRLHRQYRREAVTHKTSGCKLVGAQSLDFWPQLACKRYVQQHCVDLDHSWNIAADFGGSKKCCEETLASPHGSKTDGGDTTSDTPAKPTDPKSISDSSQVTTVKLIISENGASTNNNANEFRIPSFAYKLVNEDIVCEHGQLNPQSYVSWLPEDSYSKILDLCQGFVHMASLSPVFDLCVQCQDVVRAAETACELGLEQKRKLNALFVDKKRPMFGRDCDKQVVILDKGFVNAWKFYIRNCSKGVPAPSPVLSNSGLLCHHGLLHYDPGLLYQYRQHQVWVLVWPDEWALLCQYYSVRDASITAILTKDGYTDIEPRVCTSGCVNKKAEQEYEAQFVYQDELFNIQLISSPDDIPCSSGVEGTADVSPTTEDNQVSFKKDCNVNEVEKDKSSVSCANLQAMQQDAEEKIEKEHELENTGVDTSLVCDSNFRRSSIEHPDDTAKNLLTSTSVATGISEDNRIIAMSDCDLSPPSSGIIAPGVSAADISCKLVSLSGSNLTTSALAVVAASSYAGTAVEMCSEGSVHQLKEVGAAAPAASSAIVDGDAALSLGISNANGEVSKSLPSAIKSLTAAERTASIANVNAGQTLIEPDSDNGSRSLTCVAETLSAATPADVDAASSTDGGTDEWTSFIVKGVESKADILQIKSEIMKVEETWVDTEEDESLGENSRATEEVKDSLVRREGRSNECWPSNPALKRPCSDSDHPDSLHHSKTGVGDTQRGRRGRPRGSTVAVRGCSSHRSEARSSGRRKAAVVGEAGRRTTHYSPRTRTLTHGFSFTDTVRTVQDWVAEATGVWPALQQIWLTWSEELVTALQQQQQQQQSRVDERQKLQQEDLDLSLPSNSQVQKQELLMESEQQQQQLQDQKHPLQQEQQARVRGPIRLQEDHLKMTLGALRLKPGDTIYYLSTVNPEVELPLTPAAPSSRGQKIRRALKAKKILKKALSSSSSATKTSSHSQTASASPKKKVQTGRTVELHVTEGSRLGSQLVYPADDTGYVYRVKRIKKTTIYFSCGYTGCRACGNFKKKGDSMIGVFDLTSHHNHKRNPTHLRRLKFESVCKKRNLEEDLPASVIIKEELERWQLREEDVNLHTLNSTLYKARWRLAVDDPSSVPDVTQQQQQQPQQQQPQQQPQQQQHYPHQLDVFSPKQDKQGKPGALAFPHHVPPMHISSQPPPHQLDRF